MIDEGRLIGLLSRNQSLSLSTHHGYLIQKAVRANQSGADRQREGFEADDDAECLGGVYCAMCIAIAKRINAANHAMTITTHKGFDIFVFANNRADAP